MGMLFRYEMKKLLNRKLSWILLAVCMGILVNFDIGMLAGGDYVKGMRDVYARYEGRVLTDALAKEAQADSDTFAAAHEGEFEMVDDGEIHELMYKGRDGYISGAWQAFSAMTHDTTKERYLEMAARYQGYLDSGYYDNAKPLTQEDRSDLKYVITMFTNKPPIVHYAEGWQMLELCNQFVGIFPLFLLALCLTPLFSGEGAARMEGVLLCAAKRRRAAAAKLLAAFSATLGLFIVLYGMQLLILSLSYGLDGAMSSAYYCGWSFVTTNRTLLGVFAGNALVTLSAMLALAFLAAMASAVFRNTLAAMLVYAAFIALHFILVGDTNGGFWNLHRGPVWDTVSKIMFLLPGGVLYDGNAGNQIGRILSDPRYVAIGLLISLSIAALAAWFAPRLFLKRRKA